jgi:hypothetical protein
VDVITSGKIEETLGGGSGGRSAEFVPVDAGNRIESRRGERRRGPRISRDRIVGKGVVFSSEERRGAILVMIVTLAFKGSTVACKFF